MGLATSLREGSPAQLTATSGPQARTVDRSGNPLAGRAAPVLAATAARGGPALLAATAGVVCWAAGWRGTDWAAQIYRAGLVAQHGLVIWDPGWYGGTFPLNYSLVFPVAAAWLGLWPLAVLCCALAAFGFDRLASAELARRPAASWYFAASTAIPLAIGQLPTLMGEALALSGLACMAGGRAGPGRSGGLSTGAVLRGGRPAVGIVLGLLAGLCTPVAGSFLALALVAWGVAHLARPPRREARRQGWWRLALGAMVFAGSAALPLLFPGPGYFPFELSEAVVVVAICALLAGPWLGAHLAVRAGAVLYGVVTIVLFAVPTPMGDNDGRLAGYIGVPLVLCYLPRAARRWRVAWPGGGTVAKTTGAVATAAAVVAAALALWAWAPIVEALGGPADGASSVATFYQPLIKELHALTRGAPARVEVPPTAHHWESAYVAPAFPLARGWERQLDMAYAAIFYRPGPLRPGTYRAWLLSNGVSFVALPRAPLDYAASAEGALLRAGRVPGLLRVWHNPVWELWKVQGSTGLASAPGEVTSAGPGRVAVRLSRPGTSTLKWRWSRYWSIEGARPDQVCLTPAPGGWTEVVATTAGRWQLGISVVGADHGECRASAAVPGRAAGSGLPSNDERPMSDG
ncbi:MAG: hypothetical protein ACRDZX_07680 [Acidimicrobiales bacterium]